MNQGYAVCEGQTCDLNYLRHVGWDQSTAGIQQLYSKDTIKTISKKITELTRGVDKLNRQIIVPDIRICEVIDGVYQGFRPPTGDIYSRYVVPNDQQASMVQSIIDQTIEVITNHIRNEIGIEQANQKLSAWVQVLGDFNTHNLRQFPPIKVKEKRPNVMQFNMNY